MNTRSYSKIIKALCLICAILLLPTFVSCNKEGESEETQGEIYYTVNFNTNGGSEIAGVRIKENGYITRPEDPTLDNYVFCRWEYDNRNWDFETKQVTANMTLNAVWVSAIELFHLEPNEQNTGLLITEFKKQATFTTLKIPSVINGKPVVGFADGALMDTHDGHAASIIVPESVVYIGEEAFAGTSVPIVFKGKISYIGEGAFKNCGALESITLDEGIDSIPFMAFYECSSLKTINLPEGITTIDENAFEGCTSMKTVVLPSTLTSIQDSAFLKCDALKSIFFGGTEEQFDAIEILDGNDAMLDANIYFYSESKPDGDGTYWHYEKGNPVIW